MGTFPTLLLFRHDLRIKDNPALNEAIARGGSVIALYVLDEMTDRPYGGASKWWLHHSLLSLKQSLESLNIQLVLRRGPRLDVVRSVVEEVTPSAIVYTRNYDKPGVEFGTAMKEWGKDADCDVVSINGNLLHEPAHHKTKSGGFFKVFTPFWKSYKANETPRETVDSPAPAEMAKGGAIPSDDVEDWNLLPTRPNWAASFDGKWQPGEEGAAKSLAGFLDRALYQYADGRDIPSIAGTSALSPHIKFGEISHAQIWHAVEVATKSKGEESGDKFLAEIGWREFAHHLLYHHQELETVNFNRKFDHFPWRDDADNERLLEAWQRGQTGYPIVDAGMRQLWQTGWMHNRVRMIVGSFLVKHLLIDWREGEQWFWDTLLDACPASNTASWQWVAGTGADAAPYFRIFNPVLQGEKFDGQGDYVRRFVPELKKVPKKIIHKPWTARPQELELCGVTLGKTYPKPIVDHATARDNALKAFQTLKEVAA